MFYLISDKNSSITDTASNTGTYANMYEHSANIIAGIMPPNKTEEYRLDEGWKSARVTIEDNAKPEIGWVKEKFHKKGVTYPVKGPPGLPFKYDALAKKTIIKVNDALAGKLVKKGNTDTVEDGFQVRYCKKAPWRCNEIKGLHLDWHLSKLPLYDQQYAAKTLPPSWYQIAFYLL